MAFIIDVMEMDIIVQDVGSLMSSVVDGEMS